MTKHVERKSKHRICKSMTEVSPHYSSLQQKIDIKLPNTQLFYSNFFSQPSLRDEDRKKNSTLKRLIKAPSSASVENIVHVLMHNKYILYDYIIIHPKIYFGMPS